MKRLLVVLAALTFTAIIYAQATPKTPLSPPPQQPAAAATTTTPPPTATTAKPAPEDIVPDWNRGPGVDLTTQRPGRAPKPTPEEKRGIYPEAPGVESVQDDPNTVRVYPIQTLVNHATLIQVPSEVRKAWCGDLQAWTLEGEGNYVSVKPLSGDLSTNLHILTTDGRMYNFRLVSIPNGSYTDVFQVKSNNGYQANIDHLVDERVAALKRELQADYEQKIKTATDRASFDAARQYALQTHTDYEWSNAKSFSVSKVFNDNAFTYWTATGDEKPTIYLETKQGHKWVRELVNFNVTDGNFYRVQKILQNKDQRFVLTLRDDSLIITRRGDS
jgi:type IV secretory pathway VirB9-like protein